MSIKRIFWAALLVSWIALNWCWEASNELPEIKKEKEFVSNEVFQLVWDTLIFTESDKIHSGMYYACKDFNWSKIYLSNKENVISTDFFTRLTKEEIKQVLDASDCKKGLNI